MGAIEGTLTKEQIKAMMIHIPSMLEDLRKHDYITYKEYNTRWEKFNAEGATGGEVVNLYMMVRKNLPEDKQSKYF